MVQKDQIIHNVRAREGSIVCICGCKMFQLSTIHVPSY